MGILSATLTTNNVQGRRVHVVVHVEGVPVDIQLQSAHQSFHFRIKYWHVALEDFQAEARIEELAMILPRTSCEVK